MLSRLLLFLVCAPLAACAVDTLAARPGGGDASMVGGPDCAVDDPLVDPRNCGSCGHDCLGGECRGGRCQPVTVASGQDHPRLMTVDSQNAYWVTQGEGASPTGTVMRCRLEGGVPEALATGRINPFAIKVDTDSVYWSEGLDDGSDGAIVRAPLRGGEPAEIARGAWSAAELALDGDSVYWANYYGTAAVMSAPKAGGPARELAPQAASAFGIAVAAGELYWTDERDHVVRRMPKGGGAVTELAFVPKAPGGWLRYLAVDAKAAFTVDVYECGLWRIDLGGGPPRLLAQGPARCFDLALDGDFVYWIDSASVMRVPKAGGAASELAVAAGKPIGIAVDAHAVYWTDYSAGTVTRLAL